MENKINNNNHPYVDLDLPSKTLWATCNVGASKPSDAGFYFQWGDTNGYSATQVGKDKQFTWNDYKWYLSGNYATDEIPLKFKKYTTEGATLELEDDAAHANMGGDWHMPTPAQISELINTANTTSTWTTQDGVNGRLFTSKNDSSKSIFFPAAGYAWDGSVHYSRRNDYVWSSMLSKSGVNYGQDLYFLSYYVSLDYYYRYFGFSVRGVLG